MSGASCKRYVSAYGPKKFGFRGQPSFANPEDDLPRDFEQHRATYYTDLNLPLAADEFVASLQTPS